VNALPIAILRGHWRGWAAEISASMRPAYALAAVVPFDGAAGPSPRRDSPEGRPASRARYRSSTAKIACGCAITSCRTQFSTDVLQYSLYRLVPTVVRLRRFEAPCRFPYCQTTSSTQESDGGLQRNRIHVATLPTKMRCRHGLYCLIVDQFPHRHPTPLR
jgi:hypothetical protein